MEDLEYYCSYCGSSGLLGIEGSPRMFRELIMMEPAERILRVLQLVAEGKLEIKDDFTTEEVLEFLEDGFALTIKEEKASEAFLSDAKNIIARWKLIEG